jgi:putative transposase
MDERNEFIEKWLKDEASFSDLCEAYGISRKTGYKWVDRFKDKGRDGLEDRSRAPLTSPQVIKDQTAEQIIAERARHPSWGARKILESLRRQKPTVSWPAASSIGELLKRHGLIVGRHKRRRTPPYTEPLGHAAAPNQVWCADFKGWFRCGDGMRCDPLTITDAFSRYLLRCRAVPKTDGVHTRAVFEAAFREYGMPEAIRTDNGSPFASVAPGGLSRLSMWWLRLGLQHERIDPGCPQQNGRHERMHKTLKQETATPPSRNVRQQQQAFESFQREYNQERPHQALDYRVPADLYAGSLRNYPTRMPELAYPNGVHFRRISQQGSLKWRGERTFLSEVLARETVGLLETGDDLFEVYYGPVLLGQFDGARHAFKAHQGRRKQKRPQR